MPQKYKKKKRKQNNVLYTVIAALLLCIVFLAMVSYLYETAEKTAYELLYTQTKQIKNDLELQIKSDMENLTTLANFAAKLYVDGEDYSLMFTSFKSVGLIENIGILTEDNMFITKLGVTDLNGKISFETESLKRAYISSRISDVTNENLEIVRLAVPIRVRGKIIGVMYGIISVDVINERYKGMADELDAQLFVFDNKTGDLIIDGVNETPGNIAMLKNRNYNDGFAYEDIITNENGYSSFVSAYTGENLYIHYSTLDIVDWRIMLARSEYHVFKDVNATLSTLLIAFLFMAVIIVLFMLVIMGSEKKRNAVTSYSSKIRKQLLEINQRHENITEALRNILSYTKSRSAFFADTDGEDFNYILPSQAKNLLCGEDRKLFVTELFRYASEVNRINNLTLNVMCIKPNVHLAKTNTNFYKFLKKHGIKEVTFATVVDKNSHISLLGTLNPKHSNVARELLEDIAVCFSIAVYNKKHLHRTEIAAVTDSLTGVCNRVAYKKDLPTFDKEMTEDFACLYIDVNELHLHNNKFGHTAGDEMLIYIANSLQEVFSNHHIYRMGGDEFLVFVRDMDLETVKVYVEYFTKRLESRSYHVAIGISYRSQGFGTAEEMVKEAEIRMYEAKAQYYQNKERVSVSATEGSDYVQIKTGIKEIDTMISVMKEHYWGIYRVSLITNNASSILMPSYLGYNQESNNFSGLLTSYISECVDNDFRRAVLNFLNYDVLKMQLAKGLTPRITYKKLNGETVILSIYNMKDTADNVDETLWVFAKD